jgi:drug/metabolite transporter (DMT)-like permease
MKRIPGSLLLTGIGEVWSALAEGRRGGSPRSGLVLMVASAAAFAAMAAVVKVLLPDTPTQAVVLSRGVIMVCAFAALGRAQGAPLLGTRPGMLLARGLLGYAALSCYFWSVHHLPLGDAVLLQYSHPVFVALIAPRLLGERAGGGHAWVLGVALVGVALIVHPTAGFRPAALVGILGSLLSGLAYLTVRELSRSEHPLTILFWFPLATIVPSLVATLALGRDAVPHDARSIAGHLLVAATALVGQVALTLGLARAGAARATAVTLSGPVFGVLFDLALFGHVPDAASLVGMLLVLGALARLGWR